MGIEVGTAQWVNEANQQSKAGCIVVFYDKEEPDTARSLQEGHACFKLKTYIRKQVPGDNLVSIDRPARDADKAEFANEWQRYKDKRVDVVDGTPIGQWPVLNLAQVAEFKAMNIHTVEQFLAMPEGHGAKVMGFNSLRAKARQFLEWAKDAEKVEQVKAEAAAKDQQIAELTAQIAQLSAQVAAMAAPKRGRPRKVPDVANAA